MVNDGEWKIEWVAINGGTPIAGWLIRENPILTMDDDWGYLFLETPSIFR